MAALGSQSIASSYEQLLHTDADGGGNGTTLVSVKDGDNGTTFDIQLSSNSTNFQTDFQVGGTQVTSNAAELNLLDGSSAANSTVSKAVVLDGSGNIALPNGKGIDFAATANSSGTMSSEVLDDYEEGTWTPILGGATSETGQSYENQVGEYTKIGRLVRASCYIEFSNKGTITGDLRIKGLPFTIGNRNNNYCGISSSFPIGWTLSANHILGFRLVLDGTSLVVEECDFSGGTPSALTTSEVGNSTRIMLTIIYDV